MSTIASSLGPACRFKGMSNEQERRLEDAKIAHAQQMQAIGRLNSDTVEELVNNILTFGPTSEYAKKGGLSALHKYALPPYGYEKSTWSQPLTPEDSERCWQVLQLLRQHQKCESASKDLVRFFLQHLKHIQPEQYELSGFPDDVEKLYVDSLLSNDPTNKFLVDVIEYQTGTVNSENLLTKVANMLISRINNSSNKQEKAQEILDMIQNRPSSKGIPENLFKKIQETLYPF